MVTVVLSVDCELISALALLAMTAAVAAALLAMDGNVMVFMLLRSTSSSFLSMPSDENELHTVRISRILYTGL